MRRRDRVTVVVAGGKTPGTVIEVEVGITFA
jgi:hypothetical protein